MGRSTRVGYETRVETRQVEVEEAKTVETEIPTIVCDCCEQEYDEDADIEFHQLDEHQDSGTTPIHVSNDRGPVKGLMFEFRPQMGTSWPANISHIQEMREQLQARLSELSGKFDSGVQLDDGNGNHAIVEIKERDLHTTMASHGQSRLDDDWDCINGHIFGRSHQSNNKTVFVVNGYTKYRIYCYEIDHGETEEADYWLCEFCYDELFG